MNNRVVDFLRAAFPFLAVLFLWRMSAAFWNPAGVLAIIPIFFCTFVRPVRWFAFYAAIFCFLIDYKFDTVLFWTVLYCLSYSVYGFQNAVDLSRTDDNGLRAFAVFYGTALFILAIAHPNFSNIVRFIWLFGWGVALYMPITIITDRVRND